MGEPLWALPWLHTARLLQPPCGSAIDLTLQIVAPPQVRMRCPNPVLIRSGLLLRGMFDRLPGARSLPWGQYRGSPGPTLLGLGALLRMRLLLRSQGGPHRSAPAGDREVPEGCPILMFLVTGGGGRAPTGTQLAGLGFIAHVIYPRATAPGFRGQGQGYDILVKGSPGSSC